MFKKPIIIIFLIFLFSTNISAKEVLFYGFNLTLSEAPQFLVRGSLAQIISVGKDGVVNPPQINGQPSGDDLLLQNWEIGKLTFMDGAFNLYVPEARGNEKVYIRVWENKDLKDANRYGDSRIYQVTSRKKIDIFKVKKLQVAFKDTNFKNDFLMVEGFDAYPIPHEKKVRLEWDPVKDLKALHYKVYYSQKPLNEDNLKQAKKIKINKDFPKDERCVFDVSLDKLKRNKKYYFGIKAFSPQKESLLSNVMPLETDFMGLAAVLTGPPLSYPNPFNPVQGQSANIRYNLNEAAPVTIYIHDMTAQIAYRKDVDGAMGTNTLNWNGINNWGQMVGAGVYLYRIVDRNENKMIGKGKILVVK